MLLLHNLCFLHTYIFEGEGNETIQKEEGANGADVSHREEGQKCER
jgi:hypothetical protein